jgi:hypothetical protein
MGSDPEFVQELVEEVILQLVVAGDIQVPADLVDPLEREVYEGASQVVLPRRGPASDPFPSSREAPGTLPWAILADQIIQVLRASQFVASIKADDQTLRWKILRIAALPVATDTVRPVPGGGGFVPPSFEGGGGAPAETRVSDDPPSPRRSEKDPNRRERPDSKRKGPTRKR